RSSDLTTTRSRAGELGKAFQFPLNREREQLWPLDGRSWLTAGPAGAGRGSRRASSAQQSGEGDEDQRSDGLHEASYGGSWAIILRSPSRRALLYSPAAHGGGTKWQSSERASDSSSRRRT